MPSAAWKNAASQTDRQPVLHFAVESVNAVTRSITTKSQWDASVTLENLNTASSEPTEANAVILVTDGAEDHAGNYQFNDVVGFSAGYGMFEEHVVVMNRPGPNSRVTRMLVSATVESDRVEPAALTLELWLSLNGGDFTMVHSETVGTFPKAISIDTEPRTKGQYDLRLVLSGPYISGRYDRDTLTLNSIVWSYETRCPDSGYLRSSALDLGSVPTVPSVFNVDDTVPAGATLTYGGRGSNDGISWFALGNVVDGGLLNPYRYYQFDVFFGSNGLATGILFEIGVTGGDEQFLHFSTHEDLPVMGAKPYLSMNLGTLNSKLELMKLGSTGEVAPHLMYLKETFEMIRDGFLRNKAVCLRLGFVGLSESDYEPIFTGLWYDYALDLYKADLTVKTRTIISRFQKVQLPKEINVSGGTRDDATCPFIEWTDRNMVSVMLDIIDLMEIQDRYIVRASFNDLTKPGGPRSGPEWNVSRRLDKDNKEEATKLLEELIVLSGVFLLQLPNGRLKASLYDPASPIVMEIRADVATFGSVDGGQADLYTRQQICYGLKHEGDLETGAARGGWLIDQDVSRNDSMTVGGVTWYCIQSHRTTLDTLPGVGERYRAYWATEWSPRNYLAGEVCLHNGPLYTCNVSHSGAASTEPGVGASWRSKWNCKPAKNGSGASDFYNSLTLINAAAEKAWGLKLDPNSAGSTDGPGYQKTWLEKWNASPAARAALASRMDSWFANPKLKLKASELPPQMWAGDNDEELLGSMVGVTGLMLPVAGAVWGQPCNRKKFFVLGKTLDPAKCLVSLDLLEV